MSQPAWLKLAYWTQLVAIGDSECLAQFSNGKAWVDWLGQFLGLSGPGQIKNYAVGEPALWRSARRSSSTSAPTPPESTRSLPRPGRESAPTWPTIMLRSGKSCPRYPPTLPGPTCCRCLPLEQTDTLAVGLGSLFTVTDLACAFGVKPQCYGSERWLPSQKGLLRVCLQAHQATGLASVRSTWRGSKPVPLWEPSQKG